MSNSDGLKNITNDRLVDAQMIPFQTCYLLIYALVLPMFGGNQGLALFLRVELWMLSKVVRTGSELEMSLHFILTRSRRYGIAPAPYKCLWADSSSISFLPTTHGGSL